MPTTPGHKTPSQTAAYADLFDRLLDCTLLLDPKSHVVLEANSACETVLGISTDRLIGRPIYAHIEPDSRDDFDKAMRVAMRRYHPRQFDSRWKLADGRFIHVEVLACPLKLSDGNEVLQLMARDVSFKRQAEAKIQSLLEDLKSANAKLEILSTTDAMTGLANFRHFTAELQKEHQRALRGSRSYSLLFFDIDHFKKYNDRNGHPAGDELLRLFAKVLRGSCRITDLVARYGGEEFAIILPDTELKGAAELAERIRQKVANTSFPEGQHQPLGRISVSVGVSSFLNRAATPAEVLQAADQAVYAAKKAGRNRIGIAEQPLDQPTAA